MTLPNCFNFWLRLSDSFEKTFSPLTAFIMEETNFAVPFAAAEIPFAASFPKTIKASAVFTMSSLMACIF